MPSRTQHCLVAAGAVLALGASTIASAPAMAAATHTAPIHAAFNPFHVARNQTSNANVSVLATKGGPTPTGRVQLVEWVGSKHVGLATRTLVGGRAALPYRTAVLGNHLFQIVYSGDKYYDTKGRSGLVALDVGTS